MGRASSHSLPAETPLTLRLPVPSKRYICKEININDPGLRRMGSKASPSQARTVLLSFPPREVCGAPANHTCRYSLSVPAAASGLTILFFALSVSVVAVWGYFQSRKTVPCFCKIAFLLLMYPFARDVGKRIRHLVLSRQRSPS